MPMAVLERGTVAALEHERSTVAMLDRLFADEHDRSPRLIGPGGEEIELPETVFHVLRQVVHAMARDQAVSVVPLHKQLTTQQAADLLNVSRPYLVQLLNAGEIPFTKTGTHRRIRFDDLLAYKQRRDEDRQTGLDRLSRMGQEMGLYS